MLRLSLYHSSWNLTACIFSDIYNYQPKACKPSTFTLLTHICLVDPSILINWTSPFSILGVADVLLSIFIIFFYRNSYKQTVKTLIRYHILRHLIWVCTVCLCPKNGALGLYGLMFWYIYFLFCVDTFRFLFLSIIYLNFIYWFRWASFGH